MTGDSWSKGGDYSVEIWFRLTKDADGYPKSKNWEQLLAEPLAEAEDCFGITSIPFFVRDVCRGDVVRARTVTNPEISEKPIFEFDRIVEKGGYNTYRLLLKRKNPKETQSLPKQNSSARAWRSNGNTTTSSQSTFLR
jgi:hypothetical protein